MDSFLGLRRIIYRLRKRIFHRKTRPNLPGLPIGIERETVDKVFCQHFGEKVVSVSYKHLSGWKSSGAYRLICKTRRGKELFLIYKNASYANDQIPALINLPVNPGPPEYAIFSQPNAPLKIFLPEIYLAEVVIPGSHYRYLMEDLGVHYRIAQSDKDIITISEWLPQLQQAFSAWTSVANTDGLIVYGRSYSTALQEYAYQKLMGYQAHSENVPLREVLSLWPKISQLHLDSEFFYHHMYSPIHGDANYTNIHIHKEDKNRIKVVDWEWAGFGSPFCDLASLLKGDTEQIEKLGLSAFIRAHQLLDPCMISNHSPKENRRFYLWSKLERGLLDAAFLSAQYLNTFHNTGFSLPGAVNQSLVRVLSTFKQLSN